MQIRWRGLELPSTVCLGTDTATDTYGLFVVEPFERGLGVTVGNSLRRILLSSIEGSAVTWVKIDGVSDEFTTIDGVVEDVTDIILNVKNIVVKSHAEQPKIMTLSGNKKGPLTAGMIDADPALEVFNPDQVIATLAKDKINFNMTMEVRKGRGYLPASENTDPDQEIGIIYVVRIELRFPVAAEINCIGNGKPRQGRDARWREKVFDFAVGLVLDPIVDCFAGLVMISREVDSPHLGAIVLL